ncbi:PAS domain S-box protein [Nannocystis sp. SCPEA4]|uniref:sensor histidine kinase n=1 Tax=Nannocystis sp. SCPEA4 TaxID=2996787 RepID=UPI00227068BF|nr:PAS domain S-box protein [Nannocystis sp. SCPEA4]
MRAERAASQPGLIVRSRRVARAAAMAGAGFGVIGLVGWATGDATLRSFVPGRPGITPNSALSLILLGSGVLLRAADGVGGVRRAVSWACAASVLAVAATTLLYELTGADLYLDGLATWWSWPGPVPQPYRSAVGAATCLALLATELLLLDVRGARRGWWAQVPVLVTAVVVLAGLTGHAYGAESLFRPSPTTLRGMSLPMAFGLALLAASLLLVRPERGIVATITSARVGGAMARKLLLPALLGPSLLGFVMVAATGMDNPRLTLSHALLATASASIAVGLTLLTAASLNRVDEARALVSDELRLWRDVVDHADEAIMVRTPDEVVIGWNPAAERLFGFRRHEIVGRSMLAIVPEDRRHEPPALLERLRRGERVPPLETVRVARSGERIAVALSLAIVHDGAGQLVGLASIVRDLRERKAAERRYADLFEHASDGIFIADLHGVIDEVNAAGCRLLGRAYEEIVGRSIQEFVPPEDATRLVASREALLGGAVEVGDWQLVARDGARVPVEVSGSIRDGCWQVFVRDLRARKAAENALARLYREEALAKAWLQGVLDGMPEAVLLVDADGQLSHNKAAQRFFAAGDGTPGFDLREPDGTAAPWTELPLMRALQGGEACSGRELVAHDAQGGRVPVLVSASPLADASGRQVGAVSVLRDITVLKEMERLREEWTAIVAHDLRQPLSVIVMSMQTLVRAAAAESGSSVEKAVLRIRGAIDRLSRMIRDLYDAARIDAHRLTLEAAPVDLRELLVEVVARTGDDCRIAVDVPAALPRVLADAGRVEQVMENLLSNALKYGDPGAPIEVTAAAAGDRVVVSTRNRGPTLSAEQNARLFHRFYRAHAETYTEGLGLGLYIAKGLVEAHGGRIWAESGDGETTFRFTLPIA